MDLRINPSPIKGAVAAPPSKSLTQRAIAAGLLANGTTVIRNPSFCNDSLAAISIVKALGAAVSATDDMITLQAGPRPVYPVSLHCGEAGLALRMFAPVASVLNTYVTMTGEGSLTRRPVNMIADALSQLGVTVTTNGGLLPLTLMGKITERSAAIDGSTGSQLLTGLLMALPLLDSDSEITVENLKSKPYISLTLQLLDDFGVRIENNDFRTFSIPGRQSYRPQEYTVEGDWSGAAFLLVAGAVAGEASVRNISSVSLQADRSIMQALSDAGCHLTVSASGVEASRSGLEAFSFDATDCPDLFPPLGALASCCSGTTRIRGVSRLFSKESDRAAAIADVLEMMGIKVKFDGDEMLITGGDIQGAVVSSHNDHRIAMMATVLATVANGPVTITGAEAVDKSFPDFYGTMTHLGARISGLSTSA